MRAVLARVQTHMARYGYDPGVGCAAYRRAAARASSAWCGQLHRRAGGRTAGRLFGEGGILSVNAGCARVGGPLYVTLERAGGREGAGNRRVETPATVNLSSANPTDSSLPSVSGTHGSRRRFLRSPRW
jgi:hypothetical protein